MPAAAAGAVIVVTWEALLPLLIVVAIVVVVAFVIAKIIDWWRSRPRPKRKQRRCILTPGKIQQMADECFYTCTDFYDDGTSVQVGEIGTTLPALVRQGLIGPDVTACPRMIVIPF